MHSHKKKRPQKSHDRKNAKLAKLTAK